MNRNLLYFFLIGFVLAGLTVFSIMRYQSQRESVAASAVELVAVRQAVEKRLQETCQDIVDRLSSFGREVAADQLFSLRLLAENNASAPEVAGKAAQFMKPMGFSLLEIMDSAGTILSSGHFPASRGNRTPQKLQLLSGDPEILEDDVAGEKVLTLQAKTSFTVADSITFYAAGGMIVDSRFLQTLSPLPEVDVLLKRGGAVLGTQNVRTISEVRDSRVIINDTAYPALQIPLASVGDSAASELIVVMAKK
jgi:hypothetical protein